MKKQYISSLAFLSFLAYVSPAIAQDNKNALPKIPTNQSPAPLAMQDKNLPTINPQAQRAFVNPLDVIKETESQNNKRGSWSAKNGSKETISYGEKSVTKTSNDKSIEPEKELENDAQPEKSTTNKSEESDSKNKEADKPDVKESDKVISNTSEDKKASEEEPEKKAETKKDVDQEKDARKNEIIKKINAAKKSIKKPQKPKRTWSID